MNVLKHIVGIVLFMLAGTSHAILIIEITEGIEGAIPIAIVPFHWEGPGVPPELDSTKIISSDLRQSGRFMPIPRKDIEAISTPHEGSEVNFKNWRLLNVDNLVIGKIKGTRSGGYNIQFELFDVLSAKSIIRFQFNALGEELRYSAHQISDIIYETLIGEPGAFNTNIAYVNVVREEGGTEKISLVVADADGYNPREILKSTKTIMSPSWSPDGKKIAYVSFEKNRSEIWVQEVYKDKRYRIAGYPGHNGAPSWSPDGKKIALALSKRRPTDRSNFDIFVYDLKKKSLKRLTKHWAIDTYPVWSPDGKTIVFTSDRSGRPQLYSLPAEGGSPARITFKGNENDRAVFSPDGKSIALVHGDGGKYSIGIMDIKSGSIRVLTDGSLDESPSFAPNGSMIIYATNHKNRGVLAAVSIDGRVKYPIPSDIGDVREPAWSPFIQNK